MASIQLGDLAIMDVSWCQEQDEGPAFRIADSVELGVAAPLGAADAMGSAAGAAMNLQVESMNSRSGASSPPASALNIRSQMPRSAQRTKRL